MKNSHLLLECRESGAKEDELKGPWSKPSLHDIHTCFFFLFKSSFAISNAFSSKSWLVAACDTLDSPKTSPNGNPFDIFDLFDLTGFISSPNWICCGVSDISILVLKGLVCTLLKWWILNRLCAWDARAEGDINVQEATKQSRTSYQRNFPWLHGKFNSLIQPSNMLIFFFFHVHPTSADRGQKAIG